MSVKYRIVDNSKKVLAEFERKKKRGLSAVGQRAVRYAKEDTPVDTGRLRNSEEYRISGSDVYIGTNVEYAKYVEFGEKSSHKTGGAHFLKNAAANHSDEYRQIFEESLKS